MLLLPRLRQTRIDAAEMHNLGLTSEHEADMRGYFPTLAFRTARIQHLRHLAKPQRR